MWAIIRKPEVFLGITAAIIYNSWLLGYWLNPKVAHIGLSSDLEAVGQPYNWLFIGGDVICALIIAAVVCLAFRTNRKTNLGLFFFLIFGLMTAASALLPLNCQTLVKECGYESIQIFRAHDLTGAIASFGLFGATFLLFRTYKLPKDFFRKGLLLLAAWSLWGIWFLVGSLLAGENHVFFQNYLVLFQEIFFILSGSLVVYLSIAYANFLAAAR